jgi:uncharacterized protein YjbJ (UPF0337 family)
VCAPSGAGRALRALGYAPIGAAPIRALARLRRAQVTQFGRWYDAEPGPIARVGPTTRRSRRGQREARAMDKDRLKGMGNKIKGEVKKAAGAMTGDEKLKAEGHLDKAKGEAQSTVGGIKDTARDMTDKDKT